jgi:hypothetical protein
VEGYCEGGDEPFEYIRSPKFLDMINTCWVFKRGSADEDRSDLYVNACPSVCDASSSVAYVPSSVA